MSDRPQILTDDDAVALAGSFQALAPNQQEWAQQKLQEYRSHRVRNPVPLTPEQVQVKEDNERTALRLFTDFDKALPDLPNAKPFADFFTGLPEDMKQATRVQRANEYFAAHIYSQSPAVVGGDTWPVTRASIANQLFDGKGREDDIAFHQEASRYLTEQRDEKVIVGGVNDDERAKIGKRDMTTEDARKSREDSLRNRAYWSAAEEFDFKDPQAVHYDMVRNFQKWQSGRRGQPGYRVGRENEYFAMWEQMYRAGEADKSKAIAAAQKAFPIIQAASDTGGANIRDALPFFRDLTPEQRGMAVEFIGELGKTKAGGVTPDMNQAEQMLVGAGRVQANMWSNFLEDAAKQQYAGLAFTEGQEVDARGFESASIEQMVEQESGNRALEGLTSEGRDPFEKQKPVVKLTAEQAKQANKIVEQKLSDFELAYQLKQISQGTLNPLRRDTIPQMALMGLAESIPAMAYTITPFGAPVRIAAYQYDAENKLIAEGVPRAEAATLSSFIGAAQAGLDHAGLAFLKRVPGVEQLLNKFTTNAAIRQLGRFTATTAAETAVELTQDVLTEAMAKEVGSWLSDNVPDTDWSKVGDDLIKQTPETMVSMVLLSALGVGTAHLRDIKNADKLVRNPEALRLLGFNAEQIGTIVYASDGVAGEIFKEEWNARVPTLPGDSKGLSTTEAAALAARAMGEKTATPDAVAPPEEPNPDIFDKAADALAPDLGVAPEVTAPAPAAIREADEQANLDAGVSNISRDENGWHLELSNPEVGQPSILDAGDAETAYKMRDELAARNLKEQVEVLREEEEKNADKIAEVEKRLKEISAQEKDAAAKPDTAAEAAGPETPSGAVATPGGAEGVSPAPGTSESGANVPAEPVPTGAPQTGLPQSEGKAADVKAGSEGLPPLSDKPDEREDDPDGTISISNANVAARRRLMGLSPRMMPLKKTWGALWERVLDAHVADENASRKLSIDLLENPRPITDFEVAMLTFDQAVRDKEYQAKEKEVAQAKSETERETRLRELEDLRDRNHEVFKLSEGLGTVSGRALAARKIHIDDTFSLVRMLSHAEAVGNQGEKLSKEKKAEITEKAAKIKETEEAISVKEEEKIQAEVERRFQQYFGGIEQARKEAGAIKKAGKSVRKWLKDKAGEAEKRMRERRAKLGAGFQALDPRDLLDGSIVVANDIASGITKAAELTKRLIEKFGEWIKPHAKMIVEAGREYHAAATAANEDQAKAKEKQAKKAAVDMGAALAMMETEAVDGEALPSKATVYELVKAHIASGKHGVDDVMAAVLKDLTPHYPDITLRQVQEIFTDYGKAIFPSADALKTELRELRTLTRLTISLERLKEKLAPLKTGPQRDKATEAVRDLTKQVNDLKKKLGFVSESPRMLAGILDAVKTRLRNEIETLEGRISRGGSTKEELAPRPGLEYDAEAADLVKRRDELKGILEKLDGPKEMTEERRVELTLAALERAEELLTRQILTGEKPAAKKPSVTNEEIELRRSYLATMRQELKERADALKERKSKAEKDELAKLKSLERAEQAYHDKIEQARLFPDDPKQGPDSEVVAKAKVARDKARVDYEAFRELNRDAIDIRQQKKSVERRIADVRRRLDAKDFAKRERREKAEDDELRELRYDLYQLQKEFLEGVLADKLAKRTIPRRVIDSIGEIMFTTRTIMTSVDLSAVLRQGGFVVLGHPIRTIKSFGEMLRSFWSEKYQLQAQRDLAVRPNSRNGLYRAAGLEILDSTTLNLAKMEEAYMGRWAMQIPRWIGAWSQQSATSGKGAVGRAAKLPYWLVQGSARAYTTFLNRLRADSFDALAATLTLTGKPTTEEAKAIAYYVNVATGRGQFPGSLDRATVPLNAIFFAPKYVTSRFQLMTGTPFWTLFGDKQGVRGSKRTVKLIAGEYARFFAGLASVYALWGLFHAGDDSDDIEFNPMSKDFGKLQFGNSRLDPLSGLSQATAFAVQFFGGYRKDTDGRIQPLDKEDGRKFGEKSRFDVLTQFLRTKLSPVAGSFVSAQTGEDVAGRPTGYWQEARKLVAPLSFRDVYETMQQQGVTKGAGITMLSLLGWSVQNFDQFAKEKIDDKDSNFLYDHGIALDRLGAEETVAQVLNVKPEFAKEEGYNVPLTEDQKAELLKRSLPDVQKAVDEARAVLTNLPDNEAEAEELKSETQKGLDWDVRAAREAALWDILEGK